MDFNIDLITEEISEYITEKIKELEINSNNVVQSIAVSALDDIQEVIKNEALNDFEAIDAIVEIFNQYHIDTGSRHDF